MGKILLKVRARVNPTYNVTTIDHHTTIALTSSMLKPFPGIFRLLINKVKNELDLELPALKLNKTNVTLS